MTEVEQKLRLSEKTQKQPLAIQGRGIILEEDSLGNLFNIVSLKNNNFPILICREQLTIEQNYQQKLSDQKIMCLNKSVSIAFSCSNFINLRQLKICQLKINNIEFMAFLEAPLLQELLVNQSQITNVKSLNKTNFTLLSNIHLSNTSVSQLNLARMRLSKSPTYLILQQQQGPEQTIMQDLSQLVKLQTKWLHQLFVEGENRISQQQLSIFTFQKRFHKVDVDGSVRSIQIYEKDGLLDFDGIKM